ncbi:putative fatty acid desaturase 3/putative delta 8-(E)-sphingolipid desaturase [Blumeria hordei DH14]|uniref:Delta 8-(E)-sphingolipid desaturase n=1 Tax=Blumeria graminis f. sp. hordei (strain DH14) TaxID=546991 RepID=N1JJZ9_BLUG1|nr:putative fatty acid desaturase 3/putative delta 8-(E)-sphingolipid desaturase [Blumeria hordei DH14]
MLSRTSTAPKGGQKNVTFSRRYIEGLISDGKTIIIFEGKVLKVDAWLKFHPGGEKSILHMVGRDATDEINALHSAQTRKRMLNYCIGRIEGPWKNFIPPIQGGTFRKYDDETIDTDEELQYSPSNFSRSSSSDILSQSSSVFDDDDLNIRLRKKSPNSSYSSMSSLLDSPKDISHMDYLTKEMIDLDLAKYPSLDPATQGEVVRKYRELLQKLHEEHLFDCNYRSYAIEAGRYGVLLSAMLLCLHYGWYAISGIFLGLLWHQLVFTVHDAGHMGITHNFTIDTVIGILIADFIGGLSLGWWKRNHNVHHIVTNSPEHDPDIEHLPFFAISHRFLQSLRSSFYERIMCYDAFAHFVIPYQAYLYYPLLTFGRFNLYFLSWEFLLRGLGPKKGPAWWHRWLELAGQVFFWYWFGYEILYKSIPNMSSRIAFLMISHMVTMPLHAQITLSHFAMSTAELGPQESFPQKMLRTTMDVDCPQWLDFIHGGLQFQVIHHLFPRMPRHNLRRTQKLVQEYCSDVGIPYALYGFVDGSKQVIDRLEEVSRQAAIISKCQKTFFEKGSSLHL